MGNDSKKKKDQENGVVVDFPVHKIKLSQSVSNGLGNDGNIASNGVKAEQISFKLENKKTLASMSLFSILFLVYFANTQVMKSQQENVVQSRSIASFGQPVKVIRNTAWEREKISELSKKSLKHDSALRGAKASKMESLLFGDLEGKYQVKLDDGKLVEVEFNSNVSSSQKPKPINDRVKFLMKNRSLLAVNFNEIQFLGEKETGRSTEESYQLKGSDGENLGQVLFEIDNSGSLLSMKVVK